MPRLSLLSALLCLCASTTLAADPRLDGYRTPPGWKLEIAATEPMVINPVTMTWGPDGRLYVVEWLAGRGPNDRIKVLTDKDGDGAFDQADLYMDGLDLPAGVCFWDGWTYVTLDHDVVRFHDPDLDGKYDKREAIVTGFGNDDSHHRVSGLTMGPDGWLYMTTGDSDCRAKGSDNSTATILRSGGVLRCKPDGSKLEVVAFGMRNPWGNVAFDDEFRIFHTDNDNEGAPGFTGCRLLHVVEGGDYGWRLREGARCCQPDFERATWNGGRPGRLGWIAETGRGAPAGLCVLNSAAFPPSTRNLLVYPDVFRKLVRAYKLKPRGSTYDVDKEFELLASDDPLFRPDDAEIGPDGALYVLDWRTDSGGAGQLNGDGQHGRIYRMTWGGTEGEPARPALDREKRIGLQKLQPLDLADALGSPDYGLRLAAGLALIGQGEGMDSVLMDVVKDRGKPVATRRHALAALVAVASNRFKPRFAFMYGIGDSDPSLRRLGAELVARHPPNDDKNMALLVMGRLDDEPQVRRALALTVGRFGWLRRAKPGQPVDEFMIFHRLQQEFEDDGKPQGMAQMGRRMQAHSDAISADTLAAKLLDVAVTTPKSDDFLHDGFTRGLEGLGPAGLDVLVHSVDPAWPRRSAAALHALQGWRGPEAADAVLNLATGGEGLPPETRAGLFRTLRELGDAVPPGPVAEWLRRDPSAAPEARVEAIRVLAAMHQRGALAAMSVLPQLLGANNADVRKAALALAVEVRSAEAKAALIDLARKADHPSDERRLALAALRAYEDKALIPTYTALFDTGGDAGFRSELLRTLGSLDFRAASKKAEDLLGSQDAELRHEAIALLGQMPQTAKVVADLYNAGKLPREDLSRVVEAVRGHAAPELQATLQTLLKNTLMAAPTAEESRRLRDFVARNGNADRGRAIYLDAKKGNCASCHRMEGDGGSVGPDLTRVWQTLSYEKRAESILDPSKEIKEGYATYKVATKDGRVVTGLLVASTPEGVTLKDAQGQEVKIPAAEIDQKGTDPTSLMPAGVVGHLTLNELADLLAFLGDQKAQEKLKK